jgi:hypothetical protein
MLGWAHAYTEDQLVEQPAIGLFAELAGWQTVSALEETFGPTGTLGRETKGEVVLLGRLRSALERLNPALPPEALANAVDELTRDRSAMSLEAANREVYRLLKEGITVSVPDRERGGQKTERLQVVDWENPANNDFLAVRQISFTGPLYTCRPDIVGYVNGLPLVVLEFKKPGVPARSAFDENITSYKHAQNGIPALFAYNALIIASNGTDSRVGSLTADWDRFFEWKRIEREDEPRRVSLEVMIRGTCDRVAPARHRGELHPVLRAQGRAGEDHRPEPPGAGRQQRHHLDAGRAGVRARAGRRVLADAGQRQVVFHGVLCPEDPAQGGGQLDVRGGDRPGGARRPDRQDLQGHGRGHRRRRATSVTRRAAPTCANCSAAITAMSSR